MPASRTTPAQPEETWSACLQQTGADVPPHDHWLTATEAATLAGFRFAVRRADWRLGRWTAKRLLAAHLAQSHDAVVRLERFEVRAAEDGAPDVWWDDARAPFTLSISHRAGRAFCALAPRNVLLGCDLELIEPRSPEFVQDYLTADERASVRHAASGDQPWMANLFWSAKESALKALRTGLRADTRSVEVVLDEVPVSDRWHRLHVRLVGTPRVFHGWARRDDAYVFTAVAHPAVPIPVDAAALF